MTAATVLGQRTKTSLEGRDADYHGYPLAVADIVATLPGASYVARASVHNPAGITIAKRYVRRAFEHQIEKRGLSLVEILTMCPTGWFKPTAEGPDYLRDSLGVEYGAGVLKDLASAR